MRYALLWTSPTCTVEGCTRTIVEHDHRTGAEFKDTRHTRLAELDRVCNGHHDLHTHQGWALVAGTGKRPMVPPDDPRHPRNTGPPGTGPPGHPVGAAGSPDDLGGSTPAGLRTECSASHRTPSDGQGRRGPPEQVDLFGDTTA